MLSAPWLAVLAVVFHATFLLSIFDIHFASPIVHGMEPRAPRLTRAPADRLVLFVADGLRADRFFEMDPNTGQARAPFLRSIMESRGAWGVSHTRVPTESRPGHVALLGGIYEDVSAVTRGWKSNPVAFDTVFNHSTFSFMLGSPDIVPMFSDALPASRVAAHTYTAAFEDFASDPAVLDSWVLDAWRTHVVPHALLNKTGTVHFLHLLGTDSAGHTFRPGSPRYVAMIGHVDAIVRDVHAQMEAFFPDARTAYVFTSDHGMSDKGSHGAGDPSETETPLVVWGAGWRGPLPAAPNDSPSPRTWETDHLRRRDVQQADVAPMLSGILGLPPPVNSVGIIAVDMFAVPPVDAARLAECNAEQMLEQLRVKQERVQARSLVRRPADRTQVIAAMLEDARIEIGRGAYGRAIATAQKSVHAALAAIAVYDGMDAAFLLVVVSAALLSWMALVAVWLSAAPDLHAPLSWSAHGVRALFALAWAVLLWVEGAPPMYYAYVALAIGMGGDVVARVWRSRATLRHRLRRASWSAVAAVLAVVLALEAMVVGFFVRATYAWLLLACAADAAVAWRAHAFAASLTLLAVFPLLPAAFGDALWLVVGAALACGTLAWWQPPSRMRVAQGLSAALVLVLVVWADVRQQERLPLHAVAQALAWIVLVGNAVALFWSAALANRSVARFAANALLHVGAMYVLLSVAYEALALLALAAALWCWVAFERTQPSQPVRAALLYLLFTYTAFFGAGNTGSLSSFEISSTYRLATVFNPFLIGALLGLKVLLPFVLVSAAYGVINAHHRAAPDRAFFLVLLLSDVLAFNFFFLVRNEGSWRDIGVSISHFGMSTAHVLFQLVMFGLPRALNIAQLDC